MENFKLTEQEKTKQSYDLILLDIKTKVDNNESLSEQEIEDLVEYDEYFVNREDGEDNRWSKYIYIVINLFDKYYSFYYEQGLTEMQPNQYDSQKLVEVHPHKQIVETIVWK